MILIHDKVINNERLILNILVNYKVIKFVFKNNPASSDTIWFFAKIRINESHLFWMIYFKLLSMVALLFWYKLNHVMKKKRGKRPSNHDLFSKLFYFL